MNPRSLYLHIDRIVVEGLAEAGRRRFASALESGLREMAESGVTDQFTRDTRKRIAALPVGQLRAGATAEQAAAQVVGAIRQSIGANGPSVGSSGRSIDPGSVRGGEARSHV